MTFRLGLSICAALCLMAFTGLSKDSSTRLSTSINGAIQINDQSSLELELENGNVVELFKQFKTGKYSIQFNFDGNDLALDDQKRGVVLFTFETEIWQNGKLLKSIKRAPMPFFPGEMLEPVETFDIIHLLTYVQGNPAKKEFPGKLEKGTYTLVLRATGQGVKGEIKQAKLVIHS